MGRKIMYAAITAFSILFSTLILLDILYWLFN